ncbi:MAG TPA: inositol monophosphatase family protein [Solirubrobacteraceae bacterium]|nr:inositol monophosphatase family protein [Solirubrobacteraceae bacterium]
MATNDTGYEDLRDLAADLVRQAGALLASRRPDHPRGDRFAGLSSAAERLIVDGLAGRRPDDGVVVEGRWAHTGNSRARWILDPLAGRVNVSYGTSSYAVSLAAEVDGVVVAGAVYSGLLGTVFDAVVGGGARADGELISCTEAAELSRALVATGFSDSVEQRARQGRVLGELLADIGNLRRIGPAALDLCELAAGHLDAFFEIGLEPWDCAAGLLVAAEAGARIGTIATPHGQVTVAAAPGVHEQLVRALRELSV